MKSYWLACLVLATGCVSAPAGRLAHSGVYNYDEVNILLSRGAQPTVDGVKALSARGVTAIINLRPGFEDPEAGAAEEATAAALRLKYRRFPLSNWRAPSEKVVEDILAAINDPSAQPVFVHCKRGADRTGTIVAIYRMSHDCWTARDAIQEARNHGMAWWQFNMRRFIRHWYRVKQKQSCVSNS